MNTATQTRLSEAEIEQYKTEGYCLPTFKVFSDEKFKALCQEFENMLSAWPEGERPEGMDTPHFGNPKLLDWALAPEVIDIVEPLLGPDILLFSTHFICKPKGDGRRVPWHEDSAYWRRQLGKMNVATVWLAIDPSTEENGCMYVIPNTHNTGKKGFSDYEGVDGTKSVFDTEIIKTQRKDELAVPCILQPNQCSLHDGRLQHGSPANTSDKRRCGWTIRFMSADCRHSDDFADRHVVYQARGRNLLEQPLADPKGDYSHILEARKSKGFRAH